MFETARGRISRESADRLLLAAMLIPLAIGRILQTSKIESMYVDGGYYLEVARHIRDGEGLVSNASLYHFGYPSFPYPTSVYPLWPALLGFAGRAFDIVWLAHWLPVTLSLIAVLCAYLFGRALWPEPMVWGKVPGLHAGHVFALGLAVHTQFVWYSSLPYTEPLGWLLVFSMCSRVVRKGPDLELPWAIELGVWLILIYFTRFQLVVVPLAVACAYAARIALGPDRLKLLRHAAVALGLFGLAAGAWYRWIEGFVFDAGLSSMLRFDQNRASDLLTPIDVIVETEGLFDLIADRASGILVAFSFRSRESYGEAYHAMHWALPLAIPWAALALARQAKREGLSGLAARLRDPSLAHWWFLGIFSAGALLSVHAIHKHYNGDWYFAGRQGLMSLPAFLLPLAWLLRQQRRAPVLLGLGLLVFTACAGGYRIARYASRPPAVLKKSDIFEELVPWLDEHKGSDGRIVVAMDSTVVQRIAWQTHGVGYHWIKPYTSYSDLLKITDVLGAEYVILRRGGLDWDWAFLTHPSRASDLFLLGELPDDCVIFKRIR